MAKQSVKDLLKKKERLIGVRQNWEAYWQDIAYYCCPAKAYITREKIEGNRLPVDVYDSVGMEALNVFSAMLHTYLTSPSAKWFNFRPDNRDLMDDKEVKIWCKDTEDKCYDALNDSNFNQQIHEAYRDFGALGTCCVFCEEDPIETIRFYTRPMREILIEENAREAVDTVFRIFPYTVRQAFNKWGDKCSKEVKDLYDKGRTEERVNIMHVVDPRFEYHPGKKDAINMKWRSVYVDVKAEKELGEGGFKSFPYMVARANKESGDIYGTSPAMGCFSDIKMVNKMSETYIRAGMKIVDPPLDVPDDGYMSQINLNPGAINYRKPAQGPGVDNRMYPIQTGGNIPIALEMIERIEKKVQRAFFVDLFLALQERDPNMTATEVLSREQERMSLLGPMLGRLMNDLLDPIVIRVFNILNEKKLLKPIPAGMAALKSSPIIDYVSPLARAQKASEAKAIDSTILRVGQMAQANPEVLDKIDFDRVVDEVADLEGVNPELIRSPEEVAKLRGARAEAQAKMQQMAMAEQGANAAAKAGQAAKGFADAKKAGQPEVKA